MTKTCISCAGSGTILVKSNKLDGVDMEEKKLTQQEAYDIATEYQFSSEIISLGPWTSYSLLNDPKHIGFVLSRYKFVAKMLDGKGTVLEIGCGDALGIPVVAQSVESVLGIDVDNRLIEDNRIRLGSIKNIEFQKINICEGIPDCQFDAAYSIDVIEHLDSELEKSFMDNTVNCLKDDGVYICGTPNITANQYASERSSIQHINLKSQKDLRALMLQYFENVFMFSMNDELLHTGYAPMSHYLFAVGAGKKERKG